MDLTLMSAALGNLKTATETAMLIKDGDLSLLGITPLKTDVGGNATSGTICIPLLEVVHQKDVAI